LGERWNSGKQQHCQSQAVACDRFKKRAQNGLAPRG
jgi:hypothetical protein